MLLLLLIAGERCSATPVSAVPCDCDSTAIMDPSFIQATYQSQGACKSNVLKREQYGPGGRGMRGRQAGSRGAQRQGHVQGVRNRLGIYLAQYPCKPHAHTYLRAIHTLRSLQEGGQKQAAHGGSPKMYRCAHPRKRIHLPCV